MLSIQRLINQLHETLSASFPELATTSTIELQSGVDKDDRWNSLSPHHWRLLPWNPSPRHHTQFMSRRRQVAKRSTTGYCATWCSVSNGLMGGRGWRAPVRNPGASAPLSPAPATRRLVRQSMEQWMLQRHEVCLLLRRESMSLSTDGSTGSDPE